MRLDLFLKMSRLIPRRSLAQEFCDAGLISVNGSAAKSSKEIKSGDEIEIRRRDSVRKFDVVSVPSSKQVSKSSSADLYRLIDEAIIDDSI